jgi:hypothetical protein
VVGGGRTHNQVRLTSRPAINKLVSDGLPSQ